MQPGTRVRLPIRYEHGPFKGELICIAHGYVISWDEWHLITRFSASPASAGTLPVVLELYEYQSNGTIRDGCRDYMTVYADRLETVPTLPPYQE